MKERAVAMEKTRSLENLHELRLMALLLDVIREKDGSGGPAGRQLQDPG